ncbi:MAG: phage integrase N-terminal SAM-like domain-containing protein [Gammaproteobacteria bacterium]|nr:phage integrase N-terminal SAM-like domain-containing protein [Gammaproteobacteria bacterium]
MSGGKRLARGEFTPKSSRLMDQVRETLRYHHYALRTEQSDVSWIFRFIRFNDKQHPRDMGKEEVAASTQNQALNAIMFLYQGCTR